MTDDKKPESGGQKPNAQPRPAPFVVPGVSTREKVTAILIGLAIFVVALFGVFKMGGRISQNTITGTIVEKTFTPYQEEQVTLGRKGIDSRKKDGDYELRVVVSGKEYIVPVHKEIYGAKKKGESFTFPRPH